MIGLLRTHANGHFTPPSLGSIAPLTDVIVHGQEVGPPFGILPEIRRTRLVAILDFLVSAVAERGFLGESLKCSRRPASRRP